MKHALVLLALLAVTSTGCINPKPKIWLWRTQVRNAGPPGLTMNMEMRVHNDNGFDIQVRNVRANVVLANRYALPPIIASPNIWLRANSVGVVQVPVTVPWNMVPNVTATAALGPFVNFRVRGFADVTGTRSLRIDVNDWKVDQEGRVSSAEIIASAGRGHLPMLPGLQLNVLPIQLPKGLVPAQ